MSFNNAKILNKKTKELKAVLDDTLRLVGNEAHAFYKNSFTNQGFTDESLNKWQPRKRINKRSGIGILMGKNQRLLNSIKKRKKNAFSIAFSSDLVYANVHNEGLRSGRGRGFQMPKRKFIGYSATLNRKLTLTINRRIERFINAA